MSFIAYHCDGRERATLAVEQVAVETIAAAVGTPFYCYSAAAITAHYAAFADAFADLGALICYALKANSTLAVVRTLAGLGAGADVVSGGELQRALAAGVPGELIVYSGVGKSRGEIETALGAGIGQFNVESVPELAAISDAAVRLGITARVALRVNPDVDARTHAMITTGRKETKFGIDLAHAREAYALAGRLPGIAPVGIAVHIGSQLLELEPFASAFAVVADLVRELRRDGHPVERIDLGGGIGIRYRDETPPAITEYAALVRRIIAPLGCRIILEPGRAIVGNAGALVTRVLYVKSGVARRFIVVDAGMNDLLRPSLYGAWHGIIPVNEPDADAHLEAADVVGPICETGDAFAVQRPMHAVGSGDLLAILSAGAYGASMASTYNARPLVPEVLVHGDRFAVIRPRVALAQVLAGEPLPDWLEDGRHG